MHSPVPLETVPLGSKPRFESLSYAWGQQSANIPFNIGHGELLITGNLENALRAVRRANEAIFIWVDAICIKQQDLIGRNHQVQLMRQIFTSASTVNIWLGAAFAGVENCLEILEQLAKGMPLGSILLKARSDITTAIENLTAIFRYPWWQRLWVGRLAERNYT